MNKVDVISDYFMDFNQNPDANTKRIKYIVRATNNFKPEILKKACDHFAGDDNRYKMPNIPVLVKKCKEIQSERQAKIRAKCERCDGEGCFLGIFYYREDSFLEVVSYNHQPQEGDRYYTAVIGKCKCPNGNHFGGRLKVTNPPQYIQQNTTFPPNIAISQYCLFLNQKARGI